MDFFGIVGVAGITVICYLVGMAIKASPWNNNQIIPVACGLVGGALGAVALATGMPDFPATDYITAVAVGVASGLASTGVNQAVKQMAAADK